MGGMSNPSRCALCGNTSGEVVWIENGYEGRSCPCGVVCTSPAPPAGAVDVTYDGHPSCFYSAYARLKARWVKTVKASGRLLEIGCGEGHFLRQAKAAGYDVAGVEASPERAAAVSRLLGVEVHCGLFEELEFPDKYDVIYHCDLLSHFPEPVTALRKMCAMLKPRGVLAFEVGTLAGIHPVWYRWIGLLGYPQHRWLYSDKSLQSLFDQAGLRVLKTRRFGLAPCVLFSRGMILLARATRRMRRRQRGLTAVSPGGRGSTMAQTTLSQIEQFFRYRVGSVAPRIGPGALFVAACPGQAGPEIS